MFCFFPGTLAETMIIEPQDQLWHQVSHVLTVGAAIFSWYLGLFALQEKSSWPTYVAETHQFPECCPKTQFLLKNKDPGLVRSRNVLALAYASHRIDKKCLETASQIHMNHWDTLDIESLRCEPSVRTGFDLNLSLLVPKILVGLICSPLKLGLLWNNTLNPMNKGTFEEIAHMVCLICRCKKKSITSFWSTPEILTNRNNSLLWNVCYPTQQRPVHYNDSFEVHQWVILSAWALPAMTH